MGNSTSSLFAGYAYSRFSCWVCRVCHCDVFFFRAKVGNYQKGDQVLLAVWVASLRVVCLISLTTSEYSVLVRQDRRSRQEVRVGAANTGDLNIRVPKKEPGRIATSYQGLDVGERLRFEEESRG